MDDRYTRYGNRSGYGRDDDQEYRGGGYGAGHDRQERSGGGWRGDSQDDRGGWRGADGWRGQERDRSDWRGRGPSARAGRDWNPPRGDQGRGRDGYDHEDRGFFSRAGDEVASWLGDDEARRRREMDQRYDDRMVRDAQGSNAYGHDRDYHSWRRQRIDELDRDYDEYRRENAQRFHDEFGSWRTDRQTQRQSLARVGGQMEVVGADGSHVGTVDKVRGDRIILTKNDPDAGGHHHSIPSRWIQSVDDKVTLRKTADEAKAHWKDEERSGAMFARDGDGGESWRGDHNLDRSFPGTY